MKFRFLALAVFAALASCAQIKPVALVPFIDNNDSMLTNDLVYQVGNTNQRFVVPAGFVTDHASIPGILKPYFEYNSKAYQYPAIVHDWLYWNQYPRDKADDVFYNAMKECGVTKLDRDAIWVGVHWGGKSAWEENKKERQQGLPRIIPVQDRDTERWPNSWPAYRKTLFQKGVRSWKEPRLQ